MSKRLIELANRLIAPGPKAAHVSCSEMHEISEGLIEALEEIEHRDQRIAELQQQLKGYVIKSYKDTLLIQCLIERWWPFVTEDSQNLLEKATDAVREPVTESVIQFQQSYKADGVEEFIAETHHRDLSGAGFCVKAREFVNRLRRELKGKGNG